MRRSATNMLTHLEDGFEMGGWCVRPHANMLHGPPDGAGVRVSAKAMQVLVVLAAHAGQFVSKDVLLEVVWAGRVVTEDVLTGAVRTLRRALGDDARDPRFIETRKGAGYRLIAAVGPARQHHQVRSHGIPRRSATVALAALVGVLAVLAAWLVLPGRPVTIAVLPFDSLSGEPRGEYLASAMTDALILNLAERDPLRVVSRTSVLPYADTTRSLPAIASELRADYIVEGSVLLSEGRLRISAQLVDGRKDTHVWAARFDRDYEDVFAVQNDVADQVVTNVIGAIAPPPRASVPVLSGTDLDEMLKARFLLARETPTSAREAHRLFERLARRHPGLPDGHAGMAQALLQLFKAYEVPLEALTEAAGSARRALERDPGHSVSYRCLAQIVQFKDWDFLGAEQLYRRALELNPSDTVAMRRYAWLLVAVQRYDDANQQIEHIRLLDPHYYASADGALLLLFSRQHEAAVAELERLNREVPGSARTLRILSTAYWAVGRYDESAMTLVQSRIAAGSSASELYSALESEGRAGLYRYLLAADAYPAPVSRAALNAQLGEYEAALRWLEQAVDQRDPGVIFLRDRPELAALHDHPRFQALVEQISPQ